MTIFSCMALTKCCLCRFTGPGTIYIQTRNPEALISWIKDQLPNNRYVWQRSMFSRASLTIIGVCSTVVVA